ncbi:MAG: hypothetical protein IIY70_02815 [Oscillospiraceae bacterium]|nr:hypothetical protein [Oscillospiraceae bacterium]
MNKSQITTKATDGTEYVSVTLPRATGKEEDFVFVGLNGKGYTIRRGVPVQLPRPVYEILTESQRQQQRQQDFIQRQQENAARSADRVVG